MMHHSLPQPRPLPLLYLLRPAQVLPQGGPVQVFRGLPDAAFPTTYRAGAGHSLDLFCP